MKISIKNLGPISAFDFDLSKDFNVIFGKNNIGKSYAITAIYLIIKNLTSENFNRNSFEMDYFYFRRQEGNKEDLKRRSPFFKLVDEYETEILKNTKSNKEELEITKEIEDLFKRIITQAIIENLEKSFTNSFSSIETLSNRFTKKPLTIELFYKDFQFCISTNNNNNLIISDLKFYKPIYLKPINSNRQPKISDDKIVMFLNKKNSRLDIFGDVLIRFYSSFKNELISVINNIYFLPASRSGLYQALSTFSAVIAELSKSRNFLSNRIELPNISEPVSDYFLYLSNISTKINKTFSAIVSEIEKDILKGQVLFNKETKKIVFSPSNLDMELDLSFTSSMISEIAPIVAYLKYIINLKDDSRMSFYIREVKPVDRYNIIFIEEPEAHLHPEIQVKLLEIFCNLLNLKVKIIMTSHSNYMFNKLSNLILDNQIAYEKVGSYLMKATELGSIIDTISMKAEEDGIKDENFAKIAEMLYEERINIYDKLNNQNN